MGHRIHSLLVFVLILRARLDGSSLRVLAALAVLCSALGLISSHRLYRTRESSASFLYILLFSLFNLGLAPFFLFNSTVPTLGQSIYVTNWETNGAFRDALILSTAGLLALIAGTSSGTAFGQRFLLPSSRTTPLKVASDEAIATPWGFRHWFSSCYGHRVFCRRVLSRRFPHIHRWLYQLESTDRKFSAPIRLRRNRACCCNDCRCESIAGSPPRIHGLHIVRCHRPPNRDPN